MTKNSQRAFLDGSHDGDGPRQVNSAAGIIERILRLLLLAGHPIGLLCWLCLIAWCGSTDGLGAVAVTAAAGIAGFLAGLWAALAAIDYIVVHCPDYVESTQMMWKADGRWQRLLDDIAARRNRRKT